FQGFEKKLVVVLGAVDTELISKYIKKFSKLPKIYDAVFQGRFHPQKGVVELIKIWRLVVDKIPKAKLVMIGDGPLMRDVKLKIENLKLENNVRLMGYVFDGDEKYKLFAQSKIVVHPALYDSGGMASAEAMAFGLPCVGFDLESYQSYYPQGMVKVKTGDLDEFANKINKFLDDKKYREKIGKEACDMIGLSWSWDKRAKEILEYVKN
ncbi:MAG: glycosyltransferase family 4 protein, partial [bacterium]|nr:glycosyltransferase family 4 protein [bacterium]